MIREGLYLTEEKNMKNKKAAAVIAAVAAAVLLCSCNPMQTGQTEMPTQENTGTVHTETPEQTATAAPERTPAVEEKYTMQTVSAIDKEHIKITGRADYGKDYAGLNWSYAGASFRGYMEGDVTISYTHMGGYSAYIRVVTDGKTEESVKLELKQGSDTAVIASVEKGYHEISIYKTSEPGNSIIRLHSVSFSGNIDLSPEKGSLNIEFIGDSITCGAGILTNESSPKDEVYERAGDAYLSFAALTARMLNADANIVAASGWGVVQGGDNPAANIPSIYDFTNGMWNNQEKWDFAAHKQDAVVISLGTNDYQLASERREEFLSGVRAFIKHVRELNPDAYIIWTYGQISKEYSKDLAKLTADMGDAKLSYLEMPANGSAGWGHPDRAHHEQYAKLLAQEISRLAGTEIKQ